MLIVCCVVLLVFDSMTTWRAIWKIAGRVPRAIFVPRAEANRGLSPTTCENRAPLRRARITYTTLWTILHSSRTSVASDILQDTIHNSPLESLIIHAAD